MITIFCSISAYTLVRSIADTCKRIRTPLQCEKAALQLNRRDTTVEDDRQNGVSYDPPYCYYEGGRLKFNSGGTNTGPCKPSDKCLCHKELAPGTCFGHN